MRLTRKLFITSLVLYFLSQILFLVNIQFPRGHNFDEFHYVPSAKQFLELKQNQNWEHPPLGKEIMAAGIAVWGDRPIGWRFMSTIFGSLTLVGMFLWGFAVFRSYNTALWIALITVSNQLLYVQARIGMLDTFMFAFLVWGLAGFSAAWRADLRPEQTSKFLIFSGLMFGLATACKWAAIVPWAVCVGLVIVVRLFQSWGTSFKNMSSDDWYHPDLWQGIRWYQWVLWLGVFPLIVYAITFTPLFFVPGTKHGLLDIIPELIRMQVRMYEGQLRVVTNHPYMSHWSGWAILKRPIWYAFDREIGPENRVRGVLLLGNPLIMWTGLLALVACLWGWLECRARDAFLVFVFYAAFYFPWAVIPRKISFYYYYYPAGMTLGLALAYVFHYGEQAEGPFLRKHWPRLLFLAVSFALFIYFFPILSALKIPGDSFQKWMWRPSWI